jgi:exopolysaccharide biosynthesis polyprenyl glycosylphosphotransferase
MTKTKKRKKDKSIVFSIMDIVITILSYFLAYFLTNLLNWQYFTFTQDYVIMLFLIIPTWIIILQTSNLTQIPRTRSYTSIFFNFLNISAFGFSLLFLYKHIFGLTTFSHYVIITFSIVNLVSLYIFRLVTYKVFKYFRANGHNIHNVILFADDQSERFISPLLEHKEWGFRIMMIITDSMAIRKKYGETIRIYPDKINIQNILDIDIIDEVIYCKKAPDNEILQKLIDVCEEIGVIFRVQSEVTSVSSNHAHLTHFEDIPFLTFMNTPRNLFALAWKSFSEFWISLIIIFILSPIMLLISILIKITSKGPIIFKQERVGLRGRKFYIYKFRTMVADAEKLKEKLKEFNESDGPAFKIKKDPRITPVGAFLRKTGLDELPQLFNVLKGEMSLIGPRPPLYSEVQKYERWYLRRLSVKPGITCTWQIIPNRNEVVFEKWMKLDIQYIEDWSIKKDLMLIIKTIKTILYGTGY